jgi:hypothetical protein
MKLIKGKGLIHKLGDEYFKEIHHARESRNTLNIMRRWKSNARSTLTLQGEIVWPRKGKCQMAKLALVGLTVCPACNGLWSNSHKHCRRSSKELL